MTLGDKQRAFTRMVADLIIFAYEQGYELTLGDAYRDPRVHGQLGEKKSYSSSNSNHKQRLAIDFNLFVRGEYIVAGDHPAYIALGEYWESLGGAWGGRYDDANHFSLEHNGRR
ncbi:M15 family metallopeptidase [Vibrio coralliilyticus]|uniref:M15 family metallopeptidase n=1 Tax=Vibrio coralliilyticus TaxID=190893 RepID=UPI00030F6734|nr:M15 family metallopeptidase [Vibrio coralliilyticus]